MIVGYDESYEVQYFAEQAGISAEQVRELIKRHGNERATLELEAKKLRNR
ncbi:DUF3606 domain-containing protein [Mesorhizobium sp. ORM16]